MAIELLLLLIVGVALWLLTYFDLGETAPPSNGTFAEIGRAHV